MGTYTANKNLYMPTVGEQGWGDLMNTNLSTIDNFLKPITVSGSTYTFTGNHVGNQSGGTITATKITNSGTLTQTGTSTFTGKITANGGIGTKALSATSITNSGTLTQTGTSTFTGKITANGGVNDYGERITALEADIGTIENTLCKTISYSGYSTITIPTHSLPSNGYGGASGIFPIYCSSIPVSGKVSVALVASYTTETSANILRISSTGLVTNNITTTQTEYTVTNATGIYVTVSGRGGHSIKIGNPVFS